MRLWLLRHAKSSWDDPSLDDRDRPLAPRGERAADRMRDLLDAEGIHPDLVVCSSAMRTRQTLARVLPALGPELEIRIEPRCYTFDATDLLERLRLVPDGVDSVMLVGHNPAIEELSVRLCATGDELPRLRQKYPTGALAEIELAAGAWLEVGERTGELTRFAIPRDLEA